MQLFRANLQRASCGGVRFLDGRGLSAEHVDAGFEDVSVGGAADTWDEGRECGGRWSSVRRSLLLRICLGGRGEWGKKGVSMLQVGQWPTHFCSRMGMRVGRGEVSDQLRFSIENYTCMLCLGVS